MTTEWLALMLEEIARKQDDARRAREELAARERAHEPLPPEFARDPDGRREDVPRTAA